MVRRKPLQTVRWQHDTMTQKQEYKLPKKVSLQASLERNPSKFIYIFLLDVNFENLIVELYVLYVFNTLLKFRLNHILFTI